MEKQSEFIHYGTIRYLLFTVDYMYLVFLSSSNMSKTFFRV